MDKEKIMEHGNRIYESIDPNNDERSFAVLSEIAEFIRKFGGEKSVFYKNITELSKKEWSGSYIVERAKPILKSFLDFLSNDLVEGVSIERKAQIDVVSDFLSQAQFLLEAEGVHPAGPAMIIGASLEEFLRNWIEELDLSLGGKKPGIDTYASILREKGYISKQDKKDIDSWGGLRNHAAHGEWDEVSNKQRIMLMLEGVNFFMQKNNEQRKILNKDL